MLLSQSTTDAILKGPRLPQPWEVLTPRFPNDNGRGNYESYNRADDYTLSPQHQSIEQYSVTPSIVIYHPEPKSYSKPENTTTQKPASILAQKPETLKTYSRPKSLDGYFAPSDSNDFKSVVESYQQGAGRELKDYVHSQGRSYMPVKNVTTGNLPQSTIAAVVTNGYEGTLVGSSDFASRVSRFARRYNIKQQTAERYVLDHEHWHLSQSPTQLGSTFLAESDVESGLAKFYQGKAAQSQNSEYSALASIASRRFAEVSRNYALN